MAESDPKKLRAFGQNSDRRSPLSDEDPLVELARIVSEDSGFSRAKPQAPAAPRHVPPAERDTQSADLEAELLQELETSFNTGGAASRAAAPAPIPPAPIPPAPTTPAAVAPAPAAPAAARPAPVSAAPRAHDESEDLLRSIEKQLGAFERRTATDRSRQDPPLQPIETAWDSPEPAQPLYEAEPDRLYEAENVAPEPVDDWSLDEPSAAHRVAENAEAPYDDHGESWRDEPQPAAPDSRGDRKVGARGGGWDSFDEESSYEPPLLRRRDRPERGHDNAAGPAFATGVAAGWNPLSANENSADRAMTQTPGQSPARGGHSDLRTTFGHFDEPRSVGRALPTEPERFDGRGSSDLETSYSDPTFGGEWQDARDQRTDDNADEPRVSAAAAVIASGMHRAARPAPENRSRRTLLTLAAVLGAVLIGGAVAAYMRSGEDGAPSGAPPVIAAEEGAVKVDAPQPEQAEGETVGQAVYDRVAGSAPGTEEQVVEGAEEPREVSRIVLPTQGEAEAELARPVGEDPAAAAGAVPGTPAAEPEIGPRRVRTFVVQPDGSIVAREPAAASQPPAPAAQQVAAAPPQEVAPIEPVPVPTVDINGGAAPAAAQAPAEPAPAQPPADGLAQDPLTAPTEAAPPAEIAAAPAAPPAVAAPQEPAASAVPPPTAGTGGYLVQVSSQRSMDQAQSSFAAMQNSYPSVLGGLQPNIQEADLGLQGVYYRVRVGPWATRAEAVEVCEALQAAGGTCFVTQ